MTFEEWWQSVKSSGQVPMWDSSNKASARLAWEAASDAEREACAKLCEEKAKGATDAPRKDYEDYSDGYTDAANECCWAIRERNDATPPQE